MAVSVQNEHSTGVRGWLLILCLNITILDPLTMLLTVFFVTSATRPYFAEHPELFRLCLASGVCRLALAVFSVYAGIALWRLVPGAPSVAKKYLLSVALYSVVAICLPLLVGVSKESYQEMAGQTFFNSLVTVAYATCWYLYLQRSRRVKATYAGS